MRPISCTSCYLDLHLTQLMQFRLASRICKFGYVLTCCRCGQLQDMERSYCSVLLQCQHGMSVYRVLQPAELKLPAHTV